MAKKTTQLKVVKKTPAGKSATKATGPASKRAGKTAETTQTTQSTKSSKSAKAAASGKKPAPAKRSAGSVERGSSSATAEGAVVSVGTGMGPSPAEVGRDFVALFNARTPDHEIWDKLFSPDFVSVEGHGASMAFHGRDAVQAKCDQWLEMSTVHGCACEGPFVGATCFAVKFQIDRTDKATGRREVIEEIAVYTVADGRVVREEFCYLMV